MPEAVPHPSQTVGVDSIVLKVSQNVLVRRFPDPDDPAVEEAQTEQTPKGEEGEYYNHRSRNVVGERIRERRVRAESVPARRHLMIKLIYEAQ